MAFPRFLPMQYDYNDARFYVRACYPEYYDKIKRWFASGTKSGVTITGTPGMTKAMDMMRF